MAKTVIPAGYRISVTSWENDGDNYKTKTLEGVAKEHVPFIVAACSLLESGSNNGGKTFGNLYDESTDGLREALDDLIAQHPDRPQYCDTGEAMTDNLLNELGLVGGGDFTTRVFESIKIEYVPTAITIEDVTKQFT